MVLGGDDDPEQALREVRGRFIAAFPRQCDSIAALLADHGGGDDRARLDGVRRVVHRLTGLAGTVGFPSVSVRAGELEALLMQDTVDEALARDLLDGIREAYSGDLMRPPEWDSSEAPVACSVMVVEDDPDQRELLEIQLQRAGHRITTVSRGDEAVRAARESRPSVVVLDVDLPGMDGYTVCRELKSDPELAAIPVIFLTTHASMDARLAGLTLGADDYLCKPVDARELLLRIARLQKPAAAPPPESTDELTYEAFAAVGDAQLSGGAASLALVRARPQERAAAAAVIRDESRRRDIVGDFDDAHLLWLMPGVDRASAAARLRQCIETARAKGLSISGAIATGAPGATIAGLVAVAGTALAEEEAQERVREPQTATVRTIVLADDDPEVMRVVDSHMRSAGFRTVLAFDGRKALDAVAEHQPDVLVLDLMMPAKTGFDVLQQLKSQPARPRVVVLSARGREDDVTRAFDLGADDYIVKPFSPQELRARILRLVQ